MLEEKEKHESHPAKEMSRALILILVGACIARPLRDRPDPVGREPRDRGGQHPRVPRGARQEDEGRYVGTATALTHACSTHLLSDSSALRHLTLPASIAVLAGEIDVGEYAISKGLNKAPHEYPDAKAQPHLQARQPDRQAVPRYTMPRRTR